jgi:hypothetical protein
MILTPHAIVGAALANMFPNDPALGFGLAFFSHYALDILPHTEYDIGNLFDKKTKTLNSIFKNSKAVLNLLFILSDFALAVILCVLFFVRDEKSAFITIVGIAGGLLPDFFQFLYYKFKCQPWIFIQKIHNKLHKIIKVKNEKFWGTFLQIVIPIFSIVIYFLLK